MAEFRMPSLGADMKEGILVAWRVKAGDRVRHGDIIAEVETDKGLFETEVFEDGVVERLLVQPGEKVPVATPLATIRAGQEAPEAVAAEEPSAEEPPRPRASPAARRLAAERGIDLATLRGTGADGAIVRADVEEAPLPEARPRPVAAPPSEGMRRAIAAAMARSNREIPHYYLETSIDMSRPLRWLASENEKRPIEKRILPAVLLIRGVARALAAVPELNGHWLDDRLQVQEAMHIGFAVSLRQGGVITPAIRHADLMGLDELMSALRDLITRARGGQLRASEMTDATVTISNLGDVGVEKVFGVIYPPQVALVGFGRVVDRPWAEGGMLGVRPVLTTTLAADHRATDGYRGGIFLDTLARALQEPERL